MSIYRDSIDLDVSFTRRNTDVSMKAKQRADIETVFDIFERHSATAKLEPFPPPPVVRPVVFPSRVQHAAETIGPGQDLNA